MDFIATQQTTTQLQIQIRSAEGRPRQQAITGGIELPQQVTEIAEHGFELLGMGFANGNYQ